MYVAPATYEPSANYQDALTRTASERGIDREYWDIFGRRHEVSPHVQKGIVEALGIDASSHEKLETGRRERFREHAATVLPPTIVVGAGNRRVPVTLQASGTGSLCYQIALEEGGQIAGSVEVSQLPVKRDLSLDHERWCVYDLSLPAELPLGYHFLQISLNGRLCGTAHLILCPERAYLPARLESGGRTAGLNITLYGLRSERNWGCGDFTDLRVLIDWAARELGVSFIGLNPLHALHNRFPYNTSPYLPLSIFYKNFIYVDLESVPEFGSSALAQSLARSPRLRESVRCLRESEFVEYEKVDALKRRFLKVLFRSLPASPERVQAFREYCEREGEMLDKFALYCALDEILHKQDRNRWTWRDWPEEFHSPDTDACRVFESRHRRTIEFYKYVQFVLDEQLAAVAEYAKDRGLTSGLYHDMALATDQFGSDLWAYREFYVSGCRVGAPPDDFSPKGQDWAFPPPNAEAHWRDGYRLFRESVRKIIQHGGALRIDHVMRLFRLFWIPDGVEAKDGIYVRDHATDLMHILALESVRSENIVVGEDLGTVTDEIRDMLSRFGILSYRLFYFEKHKDGSFKRSGEYPRQALVASTTHDLPTVAGFWSYRDIEARRAAGLADEQGWRTQMAERRAEKQRMLDKLHQEDLLPANYSRDADDVPEVDGPLHNAIIGFLAQVPSMILLLNQEDLTKETEQQNLPGSTAQYPNWRRKMKLTLEELHGPTAGDYAAMFHHQLDRTGRKTSKES
ncbi:MAG TPA: 4-alpha-glucanotransferase [Bryobacteraceae bacterium]|jgi:4-alpha-glucanotransferase|nr:4-alpha-glucanotransferase [Bryobacteraceae bacterium]